MYPPETLLARSIVPETFKEIVSVGKKLLVTVKDGPAIKTLLPSTESKPSTVVDGIINEAAFALFCCITIGKNTEEAVINPITNLAG
jgi:hypothetical protein